MSDLVHFEDVEVGQTHRFGRYEVTAEEIVEYARQFDPQPFHVDEEAARHSQFGGLIASGWHTGAMLMRMVCDVGHCRPRDERRGRLRRSEMARARPPRRRACRSRTWSWRRSSRAAAANIGVVKIAGRVLNQTGEPVMSLTSLVLYRRRPGA